MCPWCMFNFIRFIFIKSHVFVRDVSVVVIPASGISIELSFMICLIYFDVLTLALACIYKIFFFVFNIMTLRRSSYSILSTLSSSLVFFLSFLAYIWCFQYYVLYI